MCEPTTIAFLGTQMTALGGAANSVALINAGNFVRTSASLISFASNVGMNVANTYAQGQAQKRAADIQKAKFNEQQIRYAREREEQAIKDLQEKNDLKRKYAAMSSKQTVDMASTGATQDSGSFNNILLASRRAFKDDLGALGFRSLESQMKSFDLSEDASIAKEAVDPLPEVLQTTVTGIDRITKLTSEFNNPPKKKS
tara:strand:+ start:768 stop:1364 length:597 start_codon:yes stop_codon:yes gene_type:complete